MQIATMTASGEQGTASVDLADAAFSTAFNESLVHQVTTAYFARGRAGTSAQKTRAEVRGGGRKPWRQKGTGHARAGSIRSPIWRGGGVTFAARPRDYAQKVNKKMYRGAMRCIVSQLIREERVVVAESFGVESHKTRDLVSALGKLGLSDVLIVTADADDNMQLAARNLPWAATLAVGELNPVALVAYDKTLFTIAALKALEARLA